jgi:hypothetical protein
MPGLFLGKELGDKAPKNVSSLAPPRSGLAGSFNTTGPPRIAHDKFVVQCSASLTRLWRIILEQLCHRLLQHLIVLIRVVRRMICA